MTLPPFREMLLALSLLGFGDIDPAGHGVMANAAEFIADNPKFAALSGRQCQHMLVTRMDLDVDIDGLQRKAVQPVN
jgi:hypothetical protein